MTEITGIYSSHTEVISDAVLFVYPLHRVRQLAKKCARVSHEMAQFVLKIAHGTNPITQGTQLKFPTPIMAPA